MRRLHVLNKAPYAYEHCDLPTPIRKSRVWLACILTNVAIVRLLLLLPHGLPDRLRGSLVFCLLVLVSALFNRYRLSTHRCPRCGTRYTAVVEEKHRNVLYVCQPCLICWDTGTKHES